MATPPQLVSENEKSGHTVAADSGDEGVVGKVGVTSKVDPQEPEATSLPVEESSGDVIIVTGADASAHLLPLRDDSEQALTFRSIFLSSILASFQAVMNQIYAVSLKARSNGEAI